MCVSLLVCLHVCVFMCLFAFVWILHLNIMPMYYVFYVCICFNYILYDLFIYNKRMTSSYQFNTSYGLSFRFLTNPTLMKIYKHGLVQRQTLRIAYVLEAHVCMIFIAFHAYFYFQCLFSICMIFFLYIISFISICAKHDIQICIPFKKIEIDQFICLIRLRKSPFIYEK